LTEIENEFTVQQTPARKPVRTHPDDHLHREHPAPARRFIPIASSAPLMNPAAPLAPPRVSKTSDPPRPAGGVDALSPRAYRTLLLAIAALAAAMAAEGVQTFAQMRERHHVILARQAAVSPVPYGTPLPALHRAAGAAGVRVVVRSDSAAAKGAALCALAAASAADVRWIALSPAVEPCVARRVGGRMLRGGAPAAAEMGTARWMVMDADGRALYSRPGVPTAAQLRETAALLAPMSAEETIR
jgi:hypothetical protein